MSELRRRLPLVHVLWITAALVLAPAVEARADRQPLRDAGRGLRILADDAWALVTAPSRMSGEDLRNLGLVVAVGGALFAFDEDIDDFAQRNERDGAFDLTRRTGDRFGRLGLMGKTWPFYAGAMVVGYAADVPRLARMGAEILEAQWMSGSLRNASKLVLGRRRPNEDRGAYFFEFNGGTSFPSGHAASVWSAAEVVRLHVDRWWATIPLYTIAGAVSLQRVYSSAHWASDVWIGSVSGIAAARFVYRRHETPETGGLSVAPTIAPDGRPALA
ncbi:MAG TPA: phosphatase PAP2 family protein, partial [Candidatus Krumholzibacteria bacterium]|nr:phosphatase PAP2 family protein [Candidatus Krumholzibacteria bacterium]